MSRPIGLKLGVDFGSLDKSLSTVADRIEAVGRNASQRIGSLAGSVAAGGLDAGEVSEAVSQVGIQLSQGIAAGVRNSTSLMLGFAGHVDTILNRLAGAAITLFNRIDSAMKFPAFDSFFTRATLRVKNFTELWRKPLSDLDLAIGGAFGGTVAAAARVLKVLIGELSAAISGAIREALREAVASVIAEVGRLSGGFSRAEAHAAGLLQTVERTAQAARFNFGAGGLRSTVGGPRIGTGTQFTAPPPAPAPTFGFGDPRRGPLAGGEKEFRAIGNAALFAASVIPKVGAAFVSIPLGIITPLLRVHNFLTGLGKVGKKSFDDIYGASRVAFAPVAAGARVAKAGVDSVATSATQLSGIFRGLGGQILAAFGVVGVIYKAVQFLKDGVKAASDFNEATSKGRTIFGDSFGVVEAQANAMNRAFRLSRTEMIDVAAGFGAMAQGAGLSEAASAQLANRMTKMAADLSSSVNRPFSEMGDSIRAALAGEAEPLRRFGVNMVQTNVEAYALSHGIATSAKAMTDQQKIMARAGLIMEGLRYAQDDLTRTADGAANQFRKAGGGVQEFGLRIGQLLLPAVTAATSGFNEFLAIVLDGLETGIPVIQSWADTFTSAFERVGVVARNFTSFWQIAQLRVGEFVINAIAWIGTIPANWGPITEWLGRNWFNLLVDLGNVTASAFTNLLTNAKAFGVALWDALKGNGFEFTWTPLLEGFKATTEQLPDLIRPDLISVDDAVSEIFKDIDKKEEARRAAMAKAGGPAPKPPGPVAATEAAKVPEYKIASAVEIGSKEASTILARAASPGARANDLARQGVDVAKDSNATLKRIDDKLGRAQPAFKVV